MTTRTGRPPTIEGGLSRRINFMAPKDWPDAFRSAGFTSADIRRAAYEAAKARGIALSSPDAAPQPEAPPSPPTPTAKPGGHNWGSPDHTGASNCTNSGCPIRVYKGVWQRRVGAHWRTTSIEPIPPCHGTPITP